MSTENSMDAAEERYIARHGVSFNPWLGPPKYKSPVQLLEEEVLTKTDDIYNNWFDSVFSCGKYENPFDSYHYSESETELEIDEVDLDPTDYIDLVAADNTIRYLILTTPKIQDLIYKSWAEERSPELLLEKIGEVLRDGTALDEHLEPYFAAVAQAGGN